MPDEELGEMLLFTNICTQIELDTLTGKIPEGKESGVHDKVNLLPRFRKAHKL